jgi:hypothetical protein
MGQLPPLAAEHILSVNVPLKHKWLYPLYAADIEFAPRDKQILNYLTDGKPVMVPKPRTGALFSYAKVQRRRPA